MRAVVAAVAVVTLSLLTVVAPSASARAADAPGVSNPVYFQTQGPDDLIGYGDYYSSSVAQGGAGTDHVLSFVTPMAWQAALPITVAIYDPESWGGVLGSGLPAGDEVRGSNNPTTFWIVERPSGATVASTAYGVDDHSTHGLWDQLVTFVPTPGSTYEIHTTTGSDDENSWRARVSYDPDCAIGTATCTAAQLDNGNERDDLDNVSGTGDELYLNPVRVAYQHDSSADVCHNHYFFVPDTMASVTMRNFDLDETGSVTYTRGDGSTVSGTPSASGVWALDTVDVGAGQSGWWTVTFCYNAKNLYVFESTQNLRLYMDELPGAPALAVAKSDGVTTAEWGDALDYTIDITNTSNTLPNPGSAVGVVVSDTLPPGLEYEACSMGGAAGSCTESGGVVTWTLTDPISAGATVTVGLATTVAANFTGTVTNTAIADFNDVYGNNYPDVSGSDSADTIEPPRLTVSKTSSAAGALVVPGQELTYTVQITNPSIAAHTNVVVTDMVPEGTTYVPGSTVVTLPGTPVSMTATDGFASGYGGGSGWLGPWTEYGDEGSASAGRVYVIGSRAHFTGPNAGIVRTVNVAQATSATLSFTVGDDGCCSATASDLFAWGISVDGGEYQRLGARNGNSSTSGTTVLVDLTPYLPASTIQVSFDGLSTMSSSYFWYNVSGVALTTITPPFETNASDGTLVSGEPPTLITAADGIDLAPGESMTVTYKVVVNDPIMSSTQTLITNTATVTSAQNPVGSQGSVTDELDRSPVLDVTKTGPASAVVSDTVSYAFTVSHSPSSDGSPVSGVTLVDDVAGAPTYVGGDDGDGLLEFGETWTYAVDYTVTSGDPNPLVNTATVGGTDLNGEAIPVATARHSTVVSAAAPSISLTKTAASDDFILGDEILYTLTATNSGNVPLTSVTLADSLEGAAFVGPCDPATLAPGESLACTVSYTATRDDVAAAMVTNGASVTGMPPTGPAVSDTATVTIVGRDAPQIGVVVTVNSRNYFVAGEALRFTVVVSNTGPVTLHHSQLASTLAGADTTDCDALDEVLLPGETMTCNVDYVVKEADLEASELVLSVVASGESTTAISVTAEGRRNTVPVIALAFTGFEADAPVRTACLLVGIGSLLLVVARRRRDRLGW